MYAAECARGVGTKERRRGLHFVYDAAMFKRPPSNAMVEVCALAICNIASRCGTCRAGKTQKEASRGFEPRSLDSESRVLTVTPRGQVAGKGKSSIAPG